MEENFNITEFGILQFTTSELKALPSEDLNFLLSASLINNDVRFMWMILGRSKNDGLSDELKEMQVVRLLWALRKLSSIIFEAQISLRRFVKSNAIVRNILNGGINILGDDLRNGHFLKLSKELRDKSTYHYDTGNTLQILNGFADTAKHSYFAHLQHGNSISGLCEQVLTLSRIAVGGNVGELDDFHDWCMKCSNSIMHFCNLAIAGTILERMPNKHVQLKEIAMNHEAANMEHRWPLCLIVNPTSKIGPSNK